MKLHEVLNSKLKPADITWHKNDNVDEGIFEYDNTVYEIGIKHHDMSHFGEFSKNVYEIHFSIIEDKTKSITMSKKGQAGRILSIIKNAVIYKIETESLNPDIIIASISMKESDNTPKSIESRKRMYGYILSAFKHEIGLNYEYDWVVGIDYMAKIISNYELNYIEQKFMKLMLAGK
jgi:hypothetical protein